MPEWPEHGYVENDENNTCYWKVRTFWKLSDSLPVEYVPLEIFDWGRRMLLGHTKSVIVTKRTA